MRERRGMKKQTNPLRKDGKTIFKLLEKRWLAELPLISEERKRDRFEGKEER